MIQLPPEVFSAIVSYASPHDTLALSRTSKAFQRAAEPRIYEFMMLRDAKSAFLAFRALLVRDAYRGPYVKRMFIFQDQRRVTLGNNLKNAPPEWWFALQQALLKTVNLEMLGLHDPNCINSWVLDHEDIRFQLREATLRLPWDAHMVAFLQTQHKLQTLSIADAHDDGPLYPLSPTALPVLDTFAGPLLAIPELLGCPLQRIQMSADEESVPLIPTIVSDLGKIMKTLTNLSILGLPEELVIETLELVSNSVFASQLRYIGILRLPTAFNEWHYIPRCLMKLHSLVSIEFEATHWTPRPVEMFQRMILHEMRVYRPTLQVGVFWIAQYRFQWFYRDGQWHLVSQAGRSPLNDGLWRN